MLTPQHEQVLALISAGSSIIAAAQTAGIHRNTIYNWLRSDIFFRQALHAAREAKSTYWRDQAEQHAATAIETIRALMTDRDAPASVRLKAAQFILNLTLIVPNSAQPEPAAEIQPALLPEAPEPMPDPLEPPAPAAPSATLPSPPKLHNSAQPKPGRNELCPCGSGKKFKRCCLDKPAIAA